MNDSKPIVREGLLHDPALPTPLPILSDSFQDWLESHRSFSYESEGGNLSCYKDDRGYWTASMSIKGRKYKKRLPLPITERKLVEAIRSARKRHKDSRSSTADRVADLDDPIAILQYVAKMAPPQMAAALEKAEAMVQEMAITPKCDPVFPDDYAELVAARDFLDELTEAIDSRQKGFTVNSFARGIASIRQRRVIPPDESLLRG